MHFPALIQDLAVILGVAAIVTFIFKKIKQPVVLGYIIAGVIVGPYTPDIFSISDTVSIKIWAELGVIFLMFSLGLEFSFRRLMRVGMSAGITALVQILTMIALGFIAAKILGWSRMDALFLGCMISISSTTIIIKALEELKLNSKRFAELVFGILIVEDLAAILMLVALTNIATTSEFSSMSLLMAGAKLVIVVAAWFVVGIFAVPRLVKSVSKHGNDEMLTVVATGLCLVLVAVAAKFEYSIALGAFIMGSILAESAEVKRIERLVQPLKDIFGAVFFVSVGMLLDPNTLINNWYDIVLVSLFIICGMAFSVTFGAFVTGQNIKTSVQTGFSMAQIGEFSFIIGSLGLAYKVINPIVYPIIVAAALTTTFTTPYLIKLSEPFAAKLEACLPASILDTLNRYTHWIQRRTVSSERRKTYMKSAIKWTLNGVVVITVFTVAASALLPQIANILNDDPLSTAGTWLVSFVVSSPSLSAMFNAFRGVRGKNGRADIASSGAQIIGGVLTLVLLGLVSVEYFPALMTLGVTLILCGAFLVLFRRRISVYYRWLEAQFHSGFEAEDVSTPSKTKNHEKFSLWDAHLIEVKVPANSRIVGKSLSAIGLRETYGLNVVVISREGKDVVAPKATDIVYPSDHLLCFATDAEIEAFKADMERNELNNAEIDANEDYALKRFRISAKSELHNVSIRASGIRERHDCIVVGIERNGKRTRGPLSDSLLNAGDVVWVVGCNDKLNSLALLLET